LQAKGLIETRHGIGSFVLPPHIDNSIPLGDASTMHEILSMLELRGAIETECAGLATQRISAAEIEALRLALEAIEQDQAEGNDSA
ncbi:FadR/GntR family transcriptional regulator, partial [Klebsiella aerogenes]|uniref:FadR/GntR family transcriptional regulator n=1 Tax=Klebsiella aerogenes TaxID=548 RepID=UPI0013D11B73